MPWNKSARRVGGVLFFQNQGEEGGRKAPSMAGKAGGPAFLTLLVLSILLLQPAAASAGLIISEYVEGSGNNKLLEIYNGTDSSINLDGYFIDIYSNGNQALSSQGHIALTPMILAPRDVFVIANNDSAYTTGVDQLSGKLNFNGNDAIVLGLASGTVVDVIGQVGCDPGTEWGSGLTSTADNTLRRKPSVLTGDTNANNPFDPSLEWYGYAANTFDGLGSHAMDPSRSPVPIPASFLLLGSGLLGIFGIKRGR